MRTIDRAAIFEEIQQNKMQEMRNQLTNNKGFARKLNMSNMTSQNANHKSLANSSMNRFVAHNQISFKGGIGFPQMGGLAAATTASQTSYGNKQEKTSVSPKQGNQEVQNMSINSGTHAIGGQQVQQSQRSIDLSPSLQYSRAALRQLKESSQSPKAHLQPAAEAFMNIAPGFNKEAAGRLAENEEMNISEGAHGFHLSTGQA